MNKNKKLNKMYYVQTLQDELYFCLFDFPKKSILRIIELLGNLLTQTNQTKSSTDCTIRTVGSK